MKIFTGSKKTPDGFYVILVKLEASDTIEHLLELFSLKDLIIERYGEMVIIKTKSRKIQRYIYRRMMKKLS